MHESNALTEALEQAIAHHLAGRLPEAERLYRTILDAQPRHADVNHNLGVLNLQRGQPETALPFLATAAEAGQADYWASYIDALIQAGHIDEALAAGARAKEKGQADQRSDALMARARLEKANAHMRRALAEQTAGRLAAALEANQEALAVAPVYAEAQCNLGNVLLALQRPEDALAAYRRALEIKPDYAECYYNIANVLRGMGRLDAAEASYRRALALKPLSEASLNLGGLLTQLLRPDEAVATYRAGLKADPEFLGLHANLLLNQPFGSTHDPQANFAETKKVGEAFAAAAAVNRFDHYAINPDPERRLRVGYLSGSLNAHVLSPYIEPVLRAHRRSGVEVYVYAHVPNPDAVTARLQGLADHWRFVHLLGDREAATQIAADQIDILVDLMGYWEGNRLGVFAHKPAPIQVAYLCQTLTTGMPTIGYAIGDRWLNLDGGMQALATEQVVELRGGFQVTSFDQAPPVAPPPSGASGHVTFGCFGNPLKISERSAALWSAVLARVPDARLLLKGNRIDWRPVQDVLAARLMHHGIARDRIAFAPLQPEGAFLSFHDNVDIILDTTPFTGGRTTIDALYMGVPVVTLIGETAYGRYSYSHLTRIGAPELIARTDAEYVGIATALANDPARLGDYRQRLRPALISSSLFDADRHVAELEDAYRTMWRTWCAAQ